MMAPIEHPDYPATPGRWCVFVTSDGVHGCVGSYRWKWLALCRVHSTLRFWPGEKRVDLEWVGKGVSRDR
jgi:hypothetical protein